MTRERWGAFSVVAHKDAFALARDVLLYDRLILPYPRGDAEEKLWAENNWDQKLLDLRLDLLNDIAKPYNWDEHARAKFGETFATMRQEVDAMAMTPMLIRQWIEEELRKEGIRVVAAFRSEKDFREDFIRATKPAAGPVVAFAVAEEVAVPFVGMDPETALRKACDLARDEAFRRSRRAHYRWQEEVGERIASGKIDIEDAKQELRDLLADYNGRVVEADRQARKQIVVTLAGTAAAIAGALLAGPVGWATLLAAAPATGLLLIERDVSLSGVEPAVMLYEMSRALH